MGRLRVSTDCTSASMVLGTISPQPDFDQAAHYRSPGHHVDGGSLAEHRRRYRATARAAGASRQVPCANQDYYCQSP
jgi:hypothetical protein